MIQPTLPWRKLRSPRADRAPAAPARIAHMPMEAASTAGRTLRAGDSLHPRLAVAWMVILNLLTATALLLWRGRRLHQGGRALD
jgi:hypothetical protein